MMMFRALCCLLIALPCYANAQLQCPRLTVRDLGNTTTLSADGLVAMSLITAGESPTPVPVRIINYRILCDAAGLRRNESSYVSVLVEFQCSFLGGSGNLADCDGVTNVTRQYQYRCSSSNEWENGRVAETLSPSATFQTEPTNQCRVCLDPTEFPTSPIDGDTHCLPCAGCNLGQGRCYISNLMEQCCSFYLEDECLDNSTCPAPLVADSTTFECGCYSITLGNGTVDYTNGLTVGSVVTHTCDSGYRLSGEVARNCTINGWTGQNSTCELISCSELSIANGEVDIVPPDRSITAKATYSCLGDYNIKGDRERLCQEDGTWSGAAPECEKKSGLSTGGIVGIVIGLLIGLLVIALIIAVIVYVVWRWKQHNTENKKPVQDSVEASVEDNKVTSATEKD